MQLWARLLSTPPILGLLAVIAVSFVCVLWLRWPRRRRRRVADGQSGLSGRSGTEARRSRPGALGAQSGGAKARPAAGGQTREQARRQRMDRMETSKKAKRTYDNLVIELERARSTSPDAGASAPAEKGNNDDEQECKQDIQRRHTSRKAGRHEPEFFSAAGARPAAREGDQDRTAALGASAKNEWRRETLERAKKTHENLLNLDVELEDDAQLCTCAYRKMIVEKRAIAESSKKRELAEKRVHVAGNDGARDSSPVAPSSESGPHPRSALRTSSSAAGPAAFGAARRQGKTTSPSVRGGASPLSLPARSGASTSSTTPIEKQQMRISSGVQFYSHVVHARLKLYDPPKERPAPQPADASEPQTPLRHRPYSYWDLLKIQHNQHNDIGLSQRQVSPQAAESPAAATKRSRPQAPTVIERFGGHRASVAEEISAAEPRPPWHSSGDLRLQAARRSMAARGEEHRGDSGLSEAATECGGATTAAVTRSL